MEGNQGYRTDHKYCQPWKNVKVKAQLTKVGRWKMRGEVKEKMGELMTFFYKVELSVLKI